MKNFFANVWTKRAASLVSLLYALGACYICYCSIFYEIHISSAVSLCLMISGVSILAMVFMLYSRKQILTRISSFIILPVMLPVVLFYFGHWGMIIPIIITGLLIMLLSGAGEGTKTAFGTVFLLMYIFGALGYFLFTSFFVTSAKTNTVASGESPSGKYRYSIVNTEDTSNGSTAVYIEPNDADLKYPFVKLTLKNMSKIVHLTRPIDENAQIQWVTQSRQDITTYLNSISDTISVHLSDSQLKKLGYTYDNKLILTDLTYYQKAAVGKDANFFGKIYLDELTAEQLEVFDIGKDQSGRYYVLHPSAELLDDINKKSSETVYLSDLDSEWQSVHNVEKDDSVMLKTLTDADLAMLGVPESGDVMMYNGEVCFRYYVAVLDSYFNVNDRKLSLSLIG